MLDQNKKTKEPWFQPLSISNLNLYQYENLNFFIVEHGNVQFTLQLKNILSKGNFEAIAINLPSKWKKPLSHTVADLPKISLITIENQYLLVESIDPFVESIRHSIENKLPIFFFQPDEVEYQPQNIYMTPSRVLSSIGNPLHFNFFMKKQASMNTMIYWYNSGYLNFLNNNYKNILVLIEPEQFQGTVSALNYEGEYIGDYTEPVDYEIIPINNLLLNMLTGEFPYASYLYEKYRNKQITSDEIYNILMNDFRKLVNKKKKLIRKSSTHFKNALNYAYKLSYVKEGSLKPGLFNLVKTVKMFWDDEIALNFLYLSISNPYNRHFQIDKEKNYQLIEQIEQKHLRNAVPYPKKTAQSLKLKFKPPKPKIEHWKKDFSPVNRVSWPPEDIIIENFRNYVYTNSLKLANIQKERTEEFKGSLLDGIDFKETLRKYYEGKIYVKIEPNIKAKIGAKVFIFDHNYKKYTNKTTWYAEHPGESTLSFYGTEPENNMVGPGIGKSYYGGLLMIFPPKYIPDIWTDPFFDNFDNPLDRLVLASIIYSDQKYIAYIDSQKPLDHYQYWAKQYHKKLVFIPITQFSIKKINSVRTFHILNGKSVRQYAGHFIG